MDYNFSSYQNGAPKDADFLKLSNTIGTSIQKISQNGKNEIYKESNFVKHFFSSVIHAKNG